MQVFKQAQMFGAKALAVAGADDVGPVGPGHLHGQGAHTPAGPVDEDRVARF